MMKKTILLGLLFAAPAFANTPEHFFDSLALHPQQPPVPVATVPPPPVLTPIDPTSTIAMVAAAQTNSDSQWTWTRDNLLKVGTKIDQITADEAIEIGETVSLKNRVDALEAKAPLPGPPGPHGVPGVQGIQGVPGPQGQAGVGASCSQAVPVGYVLHVTIPWLSGATVYPDILLSSGSSTAAKLRFGTIGSRYDYSVCVPAAGNYTFRLRSSISATASGSYALHVESNGVNLGSIQVAPTTTGWVTGSIPLALQAGPQILTLVVDAKGTAEFAGDWFEVVKQ